MFKKINSVDELKKVINAFLFLKYPNEKMDSIPFKGDNQKLIFLMQRVDRHLDQYQINVKTKLAKSIKIELITDHITKFNNSKKKNKNYIIPGIFIIIGIIALINTLQPKNELHLTTIEQKNITKEENNQYNTYIKEAKVAEKNHDYKLAEKQLKKALKIAPDNQKVKDKIKETKDQIQSFKKPDHSKNTNSVVANKPDEPKEEVVPPKKETTKNEEKAEQETVKEDELPKEDETTSDNTNQDDSSIVDDVVDFFTKDETANPKDEAKENVDDLKDELNNNEDLNEGKGFFSTLWNFIKNLFIGLYEFIKGLFV